MTEAKVNLCKCADSPEPSLLAQNGIKSPHLLTQMANWVSCEKRRLWRVCIFAQSSLSLRHCSKILSSGSNGGYGHLCEQRRLWRVCTFARLTLAFAVLPQMAMICLLFTPAAKTLVSLHIWESFHESYSHWTTGVSSKISYAGSEGSSESYICTGTPEPSSQYRNIVCWLIRRLVYQYFNICVIVVSNAPWLSFITILCWWKIKGAFKVPILIS